jgi:hypothetical protein
MDECTACRNGKPPGLLGRGVFLGVLSSNLIIPRQEVLTAATAEGMTSPRNEELSTGWPPGVVRPKGISRAISRR